MLLQEINNFGVLTVTSLHPIVDYFTVTACDNSGLLTIKRT